MASTFGMSVGEIGVLFSLSSLSGLLGGLLGGLLTDRFGKKLTALVPSVCNTAVWALMPVCVLYRCG
jgi:predicted MFS family arabinose efflux permease